MTPLKWCPPPISWRNDSRHKLVILTQTHTHSHPHAENYVRAHTIGKTTKDYFINTYTHAYTHTEYKDTHSKA